ncbi:Arfaptin-1 [Sarcoptes scabiei]|uniref:Arfaptin-1 n=1 Tax=Sarcoptes scabiei TaxID=52283 RepID=A0A131ZZ57_SARSC|nr:Arfaptin-1 [Sarcoptes scabiei]KPM03585.1 arfaptin-2-like protein [Sarcoptes scabiei]
MASKTTETTYHSSLGPPVNITSFDSMQEIAIHDNTGNQLRHHRPATLSLEPSMSGSVHSNDIINSSAIITANNAINRNTPMDALKEWSLSTYKCTKQLINEKLGKCPRTVDADLEIEIEKLRDTQHKYECILKLSRDLLNQYTTMIATQNIMAEQLNELALRETKSSAVSNNANIETKDISSPAENCLSNDFKQNAEMLKSIARNGDKLLMALRFFISNLSTLIYKTIDDTIQTIRAFETARLEYDAERNSSNIMLCSNLNQTHHHHSMSNAEQSEKINQVKGKYERLKKDVIIKMKFLEENKAKVMHKQLVLFHNAFAAFASGNATALESTLKQFSIRPQQSSFLEK